MVAAAFFSAAESTLCCSPNAIEPFQIEAAAEFNQQHCWCEVEWTPLGECAAGRSDMKVVCKR